jgi:hypothetical protein
LSNFAAKILQFSVPRIFFTGIIAGMREKWRNRTAGTENGPTRLIAYRANESMSLGG